MNRALIAKYVNKAFSNVKAVTKSNSTLQKYILYGYLTVGSITATYSFVCNMKNIIKIKQFDNDDERAFFSMLFDYTTDLSYCGIKAFFHGSLCGYFLPAWSYDFKNNGIYAMKHFTPFRWHRFSNILNDRYRYHHYIGGDAIYAYSQLYESRLLTYPFWINYTPKNVSKINHGSSTFKNRVDSYVNTHKPICNICPTCKKSS
jgi:hypothetical protein